MKHNKKVLKYILLLLCVIILAVATEVIIFNGLKLYNIGNNYGIISLNEYSEISTEVIQVEKSLELDNSIFESKKIIDDFETTEIDNNVEYFDKEKNILKIKFPKMYVDRIQIEYETNKDFTLTMNCEIFNEYGNPSNQPMAITFVKEFNKITKVLSKNVDSIEIQFESSEINGFDLKEIKISNVFKFNIYRFIMMLLFYLTITIIILFRRILFKKLELLFIILSLCFGLSQIALTPCLTSYSWDDHTHLEESYFLFSNGEVSTSLSYDYSVELRKRTDNFPESYEEVNLVNEYLNKNGDVPGNGIIKNSTSIPYSKFAYIPSALAINVCKILKIPYTITFYFGKLANLLVYISILFYAIKRAKVGKKLLFMLSLLPSTIFLASQYSKDPIIIAGSILAISTLLNCYCTDEKMNLKNLLIFLISIIVASLPKMVYIPLLFLILVLNKNKFENPKTAKYTKILILILMLIGLSTFVLPSIASTSASASIGDVRGGNTSTSSQMSLILEQPVSFIKVFSKYIKETALNQIIYNQTLGRWCNFTVISSLRYYAILFMLLFFAVCTEKEEKNIKIDKKIRIILLSISFLIICLICGSMYISFTEIASPTILGVQARYYIPLLFGIFMTFKQPKIINNITKNKDIIVATIILMYIFFFEMYESMFLTICS